jgi:hypothetical protein
MYPRLHSSPQGSIVLDSLDILTQAPGVAERIPCSLLSAHWYEVDRGPIEFIGNSTPKGTDEEIVWTGIVRDTHHPPSVGQFLTMVLAQRFVKFRLTLNVRLNGITRTARSAGF